MLLNFCGGLSLSALGLRCTKLSTTGTHTAPHQPHKHLAQIIHMVSEKTSTEHKRPHVQDVSLHSTTHCNTRTVTLSLWQFQAEQGPPGYLDPTAVCSICSIKHQHCPMQEIVWLREKKHSKAKAPSLSLPLSTNYGSTLGTARCHFGVVSYVLLGKKKHKVVLCLALCGTRHRTRWSLCVPYNPGYSLNLFCDSKNHPYRTHTEPMHVPLCFH